MALLEPLGLREIQEFLVKKVRPAIMVHQEKMEEMENLELPDQWVPLDTDYLEKMANLVPLVSMASLAKMAKTESLDFQDHQEKMATTVLLVVPVCLDELDPRDQLERMDSTEVPDYKALKA